MVECYWCKSENTNAFNMYNPDGWQMWQCKDCKMVFFMPVRPRTRN
jgi:Zn-finger protein